MKSVLITAIVVSLLSACASGDPQPNLSTVTTSSVPSSTASPSPAVATTGPNVLPGATPPVMPESAKQHTADGATIFVSLLIPAIDWAYSTTDSAILKPYYASGCIPCEKSVRSFDDTRARGWHFKGGHLNLLSSGSAPTDPHHPTAERAADVRFRVDSLSVVDAGGQVVRGPFPVSEATIRFYVTWTDSGWIVVHSTNVVSK
jgi:hypothetical protein